jgi:hypothetical protein
VKRTTKTVSEITYTFDAEEVFELLRHAIEEKWPGGGVLLHRGLYGQRCDFISAGGGIAPVVQVRVSTSYESVKADDAVGQR